MIHSRQWVRDRPFLFLIIVQLALLVADAVLDRNGGNTILTAFLMGMFVLAAAVALSSVHIPTPYLRTVGSLAIACRLLEYYLRPNLFSILALVFWGGFSMLLIGFALRPDNRSTFNKLAAISAAYIAFPQFWNAVFLLIQAGDPAAFRPGPGLTAPLSYQDMLYFSYNVFTTVDVSDTLPASRLAGTAVIIAEILAQLFTVIFIARLVGVFPSSPAGTGRSSRHSLGRTGPDCEQAGKGGFCFG